MLKLYGSVTTRSERCNPLRSNKLLRLLRLGYPTVTISIIYWIFRFGVETCVQYRRVKQNLYLSVYDVFD